MLHRSSLNVGLRGVRDRRERPKPTVGPGPSHSADSQTAAPLLKRVKMSEMEIRTSETFETLEKKEKDRKELHAKFEEYKAIARERDK